MTDRDTAARVRERVLAEHRDVVAAVLECADGVAAALDRPATDGRAVADRLGSALANAGVVERLPAVLETAVAAAGRDLVAAPVAAPPYVAVTSRGPVLRGSTADGRVVVTIAAFRVERSPVRYVRAGGDPAEAVTVELA